MGQKYKYSIRKYEYCQLNIIKKEKKGPISVHFQGKMSNFAT